MLRWILVAWLCLGWVTRTARSQSTDSDALLAKISDQVKQNLEHLPNYVCLETIQRTRRIKAGGSLEPLDTLRIEVGVSGRREMYSWPGSKAFDQRELGDMVARGMVGTGNFALLPEHVFLASVAQFEYKGEQEIAGRKALRFDYEVTEDASSYKLRAPPHEAIVGFRGSVWADRETLDLIRLEAVAGEIPTELGLSEARMAMDYGRIPIGGGSFLLPASSDLVMTTLDGEQTRNLSNFTSCRQFQTESQVSFEGSSEAPRPPQTAVPTGVTALAGAAGLDLPPGISLELSLDDDIDLQNAEIGGPVRATLARALKNGESILAPEGARVAGRLVRLERESQPFEHYIVGLEFDTLQFSGGTARFMATLQDASSAPGLLRQARRMDPTFARRREAHMDILVNERHRGQGILHWDAKHPSIRKGFKTRWVTDTTR
ncbi:MAG: hypothetical protein U0Q18_01685 [Bryobacteraceae bacterium]